VRQQKLDSVNADEVEWFGVERTYGTEVQDGWRVAEDIQDWSTRRLESR